ncbi:hypothetical protein [Paracoccus pacificus]|uniref:TM2 domain-containing protein n=1 Tax=Paracoccus pacificus TaxID=1463598 RepID=A0ABW4RB45_9RHOB
MSRTPNPYAVMGLATILPGMGHVWLGLPKRGLGFVLFILLLGAATVLTAPDAASPVGRIAGGLFVWAMSILDAYRIARIRSATSAARGAGK